MVRSSRAADYPYFDNGGRPIGFAGTLTQHQSSSDPGTDLTPERGWAYLDNAVSDDVRTSLNSLPWASDIKWGY